MARPKFLKFIQNDRWQMDSLALGKLFQPALEKMVARISGLRYGVLCTSDGFNLCSIGLTENQVGKMAALSSSLLSVGEAVVSTLEPDNTGAGGLDIMTMQAAGIQIVSTRIHRPGGYLILMAAAKAPLGVVLVGVKAAADEVKKLL